MRVAVLTSGRQDWGILRSTCRALRAHPMHELRLLVGGMHCAARFGATEQWIAAESFAIAERLDWIGEGEPPDAAQQAGAALPLVAEALQRQQPDLLLVVGDRFEIAAAALAATLVGIPIAHLHGGEQTEGAFDDALRHAITKLAHLHLVSHPDHARRVLAMGEAPPSVHVVGAPGLDNLHRADLPDRAELEAYLGLSLEAPLVLVCLHPTTLAADALADVKAVTQAMDRVDATYVITLPNADPGSADLHAALVAAGDRPKRVAVPALGEQRFWGLLRGADAMLGNSSSALIEAPALGLPAVNVGDRQKGRLRGANAIDVHACPDAVEDALRTALSDAFRSSLAGSCSPYGDGRSADRILRVLDSWRPPRPARKSAVFG
jgi:UDP-hydrolysing UDP-N-acetyl-D-glucosamine 2-epimerase